MTQRLGAYSYLHERFGFLSNITKLTIEELKTAARKFITYYPTDLEDDFESEIVQFVHLMEFISERISMTSHLGDAKSPKLNMFLIIHHHDLLEAFANVEIAFRLNLCMFVTNCTGE